MKIYVYNRVDSGSNYREGGRDKDGKPCGLLLRQGKEYPESRFDPAFLKRLLEEQIIRQKEG